MTTRTQQAGPDATGRGDHNLTTAQGATPQAMHGDERYRMTGLQGDRGDRRHACAGLHHPPPCSAWRCACPGPRPRVAVRRGSSRNPLGWRTTARVERCAGEARGRRHAEIHTKFSISHTVISQSLHYRMQLTISPVLSTGSGYGDSRCTFSDRNRPPSVRPLRPFSSAVAAASKAATHHRRAPVPALRPGRRNVA